MTPEEFVEALHARGVTLNIVNNRLRLDPGSTWRTLTVDEAECVAEHRAEIKRLADGSEPTRPITDPGTEPGATPTPEPTPEPVVWTENYSRRITRQDLLDMGITGTNRAAYERARERLANQAEKERDVRATNTMLVSLLRHQRGLHGGYCE